MKCARIELPNELAYFIDKTKIDDTTDFKRVAFMLYAYIDDDIITLVKAAKLLGVNKEELTKFYHFYGLSHV